MKDFLNRGGSAPYAIAYVRQTLERIGCTAVLFGGVVRDAALQGFAAKPRDVDIVFTGAQSWDVAEAFGLEGKGHQNQMGGLKLTIEGIKVDIW
jgi:tRNA nucleotidyltransferase/poly(A) polymerase